MEDLAPEEREDMTFPTHEEDPAALDHRDMLKFQQRYIDSDHRVRYLEGVLDEIVRCYGRHSLARHLAKKALENRVSDP